MAGAFLLWKWEENDDIINSISNMEEMENVLRELEKGQKKPVSQKMFKVV